MSQIKIQDLSYYYPENQFPALRNINFELQEGELLLIVGGTGSGKSSLARVMAGLIPDFYGGRLKGKIYFNEMELKDTERRFLCSNVGIVFQDPEKQLIMTTVEGEIAFGLENLGLSQQEMFRRIAEVMSFLDLSGLKNEFTANLSGGQKQKLVLAAILAMQPRILILDEPTSQLDPMAAEEFINLIERLNREMGFTVVLIEQRLERCYHLADRLIIMERGEIICQGPPVETTRWLAANDRPFMPPVAKFFALLNLPTIPITVKDGRRELKKLLPSLPISSPTGPRAGSRKKFRPTLMRKKGNRTPIMLEFGDVWFTYPRGREVLKGINLKIEAGDFAIIMGENAAGKTTLLKMAAGLLKPDRGRVWAAGMETKNVSLTDMARHIGYLSQNPNDYLFQDSVEDELLFTMRNVGLDDRAMIKDTLEKLGLTAVSKMNPRDLSGGERQRAALASVLVTSPDLLLLDEPTRGIDCLMKAELGALLQDLNRQGMTIVVVTHDVEFAAEYAKRVIMISDGQITSMGSTLQVMRDSLFYSPQMARLFKGVADDVLIVRDALYKMNPGGEVIDIMEQK